MEPAAAVLTVLAETYLEENWFSIDFFVDFFTFLKASSRFLKLMYWFSFSSLCVLLVVVVVVVDSVSFCFEREIDGVVEVVYALICRDTFD